MKQMKCPRCNAEMKYDSEINIKGKIIVIYYCPKCRETAHKEKNK